MAPKRILMATFGSFGDVHPYMAVALGLQSRGHRATIATSALYKSKIEAEGIGFHAVRPDFSPEDTGILKLAMDRRKGTEYVLREMVLPHLRGSYEDLAEAAAHADLLLTHPLIFAGPMIAQKTGLRWASSVLAPLSFLSIYDPPVPAPAPWLAKLYRLGPPMSRLIIGLARLGIRSWSDPVRQLRAELGLPPGADPIFEGQHSPDLVLAMFSPLLGAPQPDWPPNTRVTGFPFYDRLDKGVALAPELAQFLDAGPPPIVFTLGSSAVMAAGDFYQQSAAAAASLGRRAVLLVGREPANRLAGSLPHGVVAFDYAPFSEIFPRAAVIVHQGGVGTTAQALRSGRPMLVVPFSHDQPDNAARAIRLGVARQLSRAQYKAHRVTAELGALLDDSRYTATAAQVGRRIQLEDGVSAACDALEQLL
jgi:rhamnosyltransferase subunit B